jgi:hypothetical protein
LAFNPPLDPPLLGEDMGNWGAPPNPRQGRIPALSWDLELGISSLQSRQGSLSTPLAPILGGEQKRETEGHPRTPGSIRLHRDRAVTHCMGPGQPLDSILPHLNAGPRGGVAQSRGICDGIWCSHDNPVRLYDYNMTCSCPDSPQGEYACERGIGRCSLEDDNGRTDGTRVFDGS